MEVFDAVGAVWPRHKPMSVRISATDWVPGGFDGDDAVGVAKALKAAGGDIVDVSAGQTTPGAQPVYGGVFQTPFAHQGRRGGYLPTLTDAITGYSRDLTS